MGRGDLTNEQWARLEPLLPKGKKAGRPPRWSKRQLIKRDPLAHQDGGTVAGRTRTLRPMADGVWAISALAA